MLKAEIAPYIGEKDTVLDLGAGIAQHTIHLADRCLYLDAWQPYLDKIKEMRPNARTMLGVLPFRLNDFGDKTFDVALALDVLEHMRRLGDAERLILHMKRIARKYAIVFTTVGFVPQKDGLGWGAGNPVYQKHRCGVEPEWMEKWGYSVVKKFPGDKDHKIDYEMMLAVCDCRGEGDG